MNGWPCHGRSHPSSLYVCNQKRLYLKLNREERVHTARGCEMTSTPIDCFAILPFEVDHYIYIPPFLFEKNLRWDTSFIFVLNRVEINGHSNALIEKVGRHFQGNEIGKIIVSPILRYCHITKGGIGLG
jgi:hypothetical protein